MGKQAILVTGASTGIGHATTQLLAQTGYAVFAGVRNESDAARVASLHPNITPLTLDVTKPADIRTAAALVRESGIPLYGLVNNAGIAVAGPLEFLPIDDIRRQFEINVFGPIALAQAMLPLLREQHGRIAFIGSIAGRISAPFVGPYSASKAALASLVDAMRQELAGFGIAVSLFEFAAVKTPIWSKGRNAKDELLAKLPSSAIPLYGAFIDAIVAQTKREERHGMEPRTVAEAILGALRSERPRERYVIGKQAKLQAVVAMLPPSTRDRLIKKAMQLP
ncbi:MAG: SDR family oxidoreductase [Vulcanimicrobiaceae bacterium]